MNALELKAALTILGMSYAELARRADVNERSVKRWASPSAPWDVPDDIVTDIIEPELARQDAMVKACLRVVEEQESATGKQDPVRRRGTSDSRSLRHATGVGARSTWPTPIRCASEPHWRL